MLRASLASLGIAMVLLWMVGVVDHATDWMTWLIGIAAVLTFWLVPVTRRHLGPGAVAIGPNLVGLGLIAMFIVGLATEASAWLTWFTFAAGCSYLMFGGFAFMVRAVEPSLESRRPIQEQ
jgi:hypothetical protein